MNILFVTFFFVGCIGPEIPIVSVFGHYSYSVTSLIYEILYVFLCIRFEMQHSFTETLLKRNTISMKPFRNLNILTVYTLVPTYKHVYYVTIRITTSLHTELYTSLNTPRD